MKSNSPLPARISLGVVVAMAISIPLAITLQDAHELALLQKTRHLTVGRVTMKNCENHGELVYSYTVNGHAYGGSGTPLSTSCIDVRAGDSINIIYSAEKPQLSRSDSLESWRDNIFGSLFALAMISLAAVIVIFHITRVDVAPRAAFNP
jgi:hypothetical protein